MENEPVPERPWIANMERVFEAIIFRSRWVLSPAYVVLAACLVILCLHTITELWQLVSYFRGADIFDETKVILQVLTIVDLVLVINLVLMVLFVGYVNFVSVIHPDKKEDWPPWVGLLDYAGLKLQMLGSIIAIASIKMLRAYVSLADYGQILPDRPVGPGARPADLTSERLLLWMVVIYATFLFGALVVAIVNKLHAAGSERPANPGGG